MSKKNKTQQIKAELKKQPNNIEIILQLVKEYTESGDFKSAFKTLAAYSSILSETVIQYETAKIHAKKGEEQRAVELYQALIEPLKISKRTKELADVYLQLGRLRLKTDLFHGIHYLWNSYKLSGNKDILTELEDPVFILNRHLNNSWLFVKLNNSVIAHTTLEQNQALTPILQDANPIDLWKEYAHLLKQGAHINLEIDTFVSVLDILEKKHAPLISLNDNNLIDEIGNAWCQLICDFVQFKQQVSFSLEIFKIPVFLKESGYLVNPTIKNRLYSLKNSLQTNDLPIHQFAHHTLLFLIDSFIDTPANALKKLVQEFYLLAENDPIVLYYSMRLWHQLFHTEWFAETDSETLLKNLLNFCGQCFSEFSDIENSFLIFNSFYNIASQREWNSILYSEVILPSMLSALQKEKFLYAERLATQTDMSYAQQPHTLEQHEATYKPYLPKLLESGRKIYQRVSGAGNQKTSFLETEEMLTIGFVVNLLFNHCSPIIVLKETLESLNSLNSKLFRIKIYAFYGVSETSLFDIFNNVNAELIDVSVLRSKSYEKDNFLERLLTLREKMQQDKVIAAIYIQSTLFFSALASTFYLAPTQIYWSMGGGLGFNTSEIKGYITVGFYLTSRKIKFFGKQQEWIAIPATPKNSPALFASNTILQAKAIKQQFLNNGFDVIVGTIGRPQKIDTDEFLGVIAEILHQNPKTAYLWFGPKPLPSVIQKMKALDIERQCFFQGWVDTEIYAHVLDIFLDSFPFGNGLTLLTCMSAGVPFVSLHSDDNITTLQYYLYEFLEKKFTLLEHEEQVRKIFLDESNANQILYCYSLEKENYIKNANRLIQDSVFRNKVRKANKNFMDFLFKHQNIGAEFSLALKSILEQISC